MDTSSSGGQEAAAPHYLKTKVPADATGHRVSDWDDITPPEMFAVWARSPAQDQVLRSATATRPEDADGHDDDDYDVDYGGLDEATEIAEDLDRASGYRTAYWQQAGTPEIAATWCPPTPAVRASAVTEDDAAVVADDLADEWQYTVDLSDEELAELLAEDADQDDLD